jgi:hypothetical protein
VLRFIREESHSAKLFEGDMLFLQYTQQTAFRQSAKLIFEPAISEEIKEETKPQRFVKTDFHFTLHEVIEFIVRYSIGFK